MGSDPIIAPLVIQLDELVERASYMKHLRTGKILQADFPQSHSGIPNCPFQPKELLKEDDLFWNIVEVEASQEITSAAGND